MSAMLRQIIDRFDVLAYPIVALVVFIAAFAFIVSRARRLQPDEAARLAALPLEDR